MDSDFLRTGALLSPHHPAQAVCCAPRWRGRMVSLGLICCVILGESSHLPATQLPCPFSEEVQPGDLQGSGDFWVDSQRHPLTSFPLRRASTGRPRPFTWPHPQNLTPSQRSRPLISQHLRPFSALFSPPSLESPGPPCPS